MLALWVMWKRSSLNKHWNEQKNREIQQYIKVVDMTKTEYQRLNQENYSLKRNILSNALKQQQQQQHQ